MAELQQSITPEQFIADVERALPKSTQKERDRLLQHARAWAVSFYEGEVPTAMQHRMESLEARWHS
jgi:hypothetical protein